MVVGYINHAPSSTIYKNKQDKIIKFNEAFHFCEITWITERNTTSLIQSIKHIKPFLFVCCELKELGKSPTDISELILSLTNLNIQVYIMDADLYFVMTLKIQFIL